MHCTTPRRLEWYSPEMIIPHFPNGNLPTLQSSIHCSSLVYCRHKKIHQRNTIATKYHKLKSNNVSADSFRTKISLHLQNLWKQTISISAALALSFNILPCMAITKISVQEGSKSYNIEQHEQTLANPVVDNARVLSQDKVEDISQKLKNLEVESGWKIRVLTRSGPYPAPLSDSPLRNQWSPSDKTVIIVEDITAPNILNFGVGQDVLSRLPRQFFVELQSRYGNQFFVSDEGYQAAVVRSVGAITECIVKNDGCTSVPGLTLDLYYLTLATSVSAGAVFGFGARQGDGRSVQGVLLLSPLWGLLLVFFSVLPIVGRTAELEPLVKNGVGFVLAAAAFYLTPIFGKRNG